MKYYITIITSLILSAVLFINTTVSAAAYTSCTMSASFPNQRGILVNSYSVQYVDSNGQASPMSNYNIAVYEFEHIILMNTSQPDGYLNGQFATQFTQTFTTPTGYQLEAVQMVYTPTAAQGIYSYETRSVTSSTGRSVTIRSALYNYYPRSSVVQIGILKCTISFMYPAPVDNANDPEQYIGGQLTVDSIQTNNVNLSTNPETVGTFVDYIIAGINNSYVGQDTTEINTAVQSVLSLLRNMAQTDEEKYDDILDALADNNDWNAILSSWLNSISTDTLTISQNTSDMLSFLSTYLPRLRSIDNNVLNIYNKFTEFFTYYKQQIDSGNSAASSAAQAVENVESKAAVINDVQKPNVDNFVQDVDLHITPEVTGGMNVFKAFINRPYFVLILTAVFALAFVSYLLYGKGV